MKHKIIFIHGFGVKKDSRKMFTDISRELEGRDIECILFDLNEIDDDGSIKLRPYSEQIKIVRNIFEQNRGADIVDIICHSQGCMVGALSDLDNIRKTIFLAPPTNDNNQKAIKYFSQNPKTIIDLKGESRIARRDGTFTIVPKEFSEERDRLDLDGLYKDYIDRNDCVVIEANQDDVISNNNLEKVLEGSKIIGLDANHNFDGEVREDLINIIKKELL